ncbi:MAG: septal ring lytic transglycosylase RlpA family protein [Candidatus Binatia bacterium]
MLRPAPGIVVGFAMMVACSAIRPELPDLPGLLGSSRTIPGRKLLLTASWYGRQLHGGRTASGERFDSAGFTAAHRTLPFGTVLRVSNPGNGASVLVTVNDRGPFTRGRDIDLSYGAARKLGIVSAGVSRVEVEIVEEVTVRRRAASGLLGERSR